MRLKAIALVTAAATALAGCVTQPMGPTIYANPARGKSPAAFQQDEAACEQYADQRTAGSADRANNRQTGDTVIGAVLGTAIGAAAGNTKGAIIGGATGAVLGTAASDPGYSQYGIQRQYNIAYAQCMSSKGNQVQQRPHYAGPPGYGPPPPYGPPPGYGPPPPDDYGPPPPPPGY